MHHVVRRHIPTISKKKKTLPLIGKSYVMDDIDDDDVINLLLAQVRSFFVCEVTAIDEMM